MKRESYCRLIPAMLVLLILATGCKTTEKNYQAAYEVAMKKKQAENAADDELGIEGKLEQTDGPKKRVMGGGTFYFEGRWLKRVDTSEVLRGKYCIVIAAYKMKTNSLAQAADMRAKGYDAFAAEDREGKYYVVIGVVSSLKEAGEFSAAYVEKEKPQSYVGLTNGPVVFKS